VTWAEVEGDQTPRVVGNGMDFGGAPTLTAANGLSQAHLFRRQPKFSTCENTADDLRWSRGVTPIVSLEAAAQSVLIAGRLASIRLPPIRSSQRRSSDPG
jgi:hypothetical protein